MGVLAGLGALASVAATPLPANQLAPVGQPVQVVYGVNLITNGGFEDPLAWPWWLGIPGYTDPARGTVGPDSTQRRCGARSLRMGRDDAAAFYRVAIPANAQSADFSFWVYVDSPAPVVALDQNRLDVQVFAGTSVAHNLATYYAAVPTVSRATVPVEPLRVWQKKAFDLSAYKGQMIDLSFKEWGGTFFYIDDVGLWTAQPPIASVYFC
jgi:hypothetical protein